MVPEGQASEFAGSAWRGARRTPKIPKTVIRDLLDRQYSNAIQSVMPQVWLRFVRGLPAKIAITIATNPTVEGFAPLGDLKAQCVSQCRPANIFGCCGVVHF